MLTYLSYLRRPFNQQTTSGILLNISTKREIIILFISLFSTLNIYAQNVSTASWEEVVEQLAISAEEQDINLNSIIEELSEQINEPLNLNTITKEQLEWFPFLTDIQIENILAYRYVNGPMKTIYELQLVEELDKQTIEYLLPFVCVSPVEEKEPLPTLHNLLKYAKNEAVTRFDIPFYQRKGYEDVYLGPPLYHSLRYSFRYRNQIYAGFTAEKDAGEPFGALHNTQGYDYYSFYLYLQNIRWLKALAIGNYRLSFGHGLVISNDFTMGKTSSLSTMNFRNNTIKKHSSTDEYNYFRGVAAAVQWKQWVFSSFYSHRSLDGTVSATSISSINKTGLHRTEKEAVKRDALTQQLMGGNITYKKNNIKIGATGIYYFFDKPYEPQKREYSKHNLRGNGFHNLGIDYTYRWNRLTFTGETAIGKQDGIATINSVSYSLPSNYQFIFVHRYYSIDYWAWFARSFSEGGYVQNENGYYLAMEGSPLRNWKIFLSADYFRFPWWKYLVDKPSSGFEGVFQATYFPRRNLNMLIRYQYKQKEKNYTDENKIKTIRPIYQHRFRYRMNYTPFSRLTLRFTFDYNSVYPQGVTPSRGFQLVQMAGYSFSNIPLKLEIQGGYFRTDDYTSRVYAYEKGLLYTFYTPSFYGEGIRLTAHLRWDIHKNCLLIAKYGQTTYFDKEEIGSGNDLIKDNKKQDLQLQLRIKF